jgi:hypothetical protein
MKLRISHTGDTDLIIQSNATGTRRVRPLSWFEMLRRVCVEIPIGDNEVLIIRTDRAVEPDTGKPLRNIV